MTTEGRIHIRELSVMLNRSPHTIRDWERSGRLPRHLRPLRSERGWRYWTPDQAHQLAQWMVDEDMRPGKGLPHYHPTQEQLEQHLQGQRRPRKREPVLA